jgi:Fumarase C-terminus
MQHVNLETDFDYPCSHLPLATRGPRRAVDAGLHPPREGARAIWRIEVENFPAFVVIDDKGNDFFKELNLG